jgi:hypothetical protein
VNTPHGRVDHLGGGVGGPPQRISTKKFENSGSASTASNSLPSVGQLLIAAFGISRTKNTELNQRWITMSVRVGSQLPHACRHIYCIPSTATRTIPYPLDRAVYRRRNLIERLFCRLKPNFSIKSVSRRSAIASPPPRSIV